jgi:hypothetical protein
VKLLALSLVLLAGCASHHDSPAPWGPVAATAVTPPMEMKSGTTYAQTAEYKKDAGKCVAMATSKYCQWDKETFLFNKDLFQKSVAPSASALDYAINVKILIDGTIMPKTAYIEPLKKKVNAQGIEWRRNLPVFKAILVSNGYTLVNKKSDANEVIKFDQGMTPVGNEAKRHLNVVSFKKDAEAWKVEVVSVGKNRDMKQVLPVLGSAARDYIALGKEESASIKVNEGSLSVIAFKDAVDSQK